MQRSHAQSRAVVGWDGWDHAVQRAAKGRPAGHAPRAQAIVYSRDERSSLALLLLPFVIMAFAMGLTQTMKTLHQPATLPGEASIAPARPAATTSDKVAAAIRAAPRGDGFPVPAPRQLEPAMPDLAALASSGHNPAAEVANRSPVVPSITSASFRAETAPAVRQPLMSAIAAAPAAALPPAAPNVASLAPFAQPGEAVASRSGAELIAAAAAPEAAASPTAPTAEISAATGAAAPAPSPPAAPEQRQERTRLAALAPVPVYPEIASLEAPEATDAMPPRSICVAPPVTTQQSRSAALVPAPKATDTAAFGVRLAAAAETQLADLVIYTDRYRRIAYPMGDVSPQFGVCTDVVIRAYRAVGLDLQALVQQTRAGSGDASIDHRRVETLRRFFAANGVSLRPTDFAEDYWPGDIVTYYRPQNRHSKTHIAIVAEKLGPSGRPMIIHNRGWGPQIEDGLFVDQITGHYRFTGLHDPPARNSSPNGRQVAAIPALPAMAPMVATKAATLGVIKTATARNACGPATQDVQRSCPARPALAAAQRPAGTAASSAR